MGYLKAKGYTYKSGGGGSALSVSEEGSELTSGATSINFVGGTVTAAASGTAITVTDAGGAAGQTLGNTALSSSSTVTANLSAGNIFHLTAGHNFTLAFSNATLGHQYYFIITQDGTGGRTVTWPATFHFAGGANPALSTSAAAKDAVHVICANATGGSEEFICSIGYGLG